MSAHVGSRLIFFLSVVGTFFLVLLVVSSIFRTLTLVGSPRSHPLIIFVSKTTVRSDNYLQDIAHETTFFQSHAHSISLN